MKLNFSNNGRINIYIILYLLVQWSTVYVESKYVVGELRSSENWRFLTRFCFLSEDGSFEFDVEYHLDYAPQNLLLYFDSKTQWPAVYKSDKNCNEREEVMLNENNQIINLTQADKGVDCKVLRDYNEKPYYRCRGTRSFRSARERWWFIAVSNCYTAKGLSLKYKLTLTNGYNYWYRHFSADEFYILRTDLVALAIEVGLFFLSMLAAIELKKRQLFHTTYRLYMVALIFQIFGTAFLILHYGRYGHDGYGVPSSKLFGRILHSVSTIVMVLLLLLMAKGLNITRGRLRQISSIKLTAFMCFYSITYATLFLYEQNFFDPGEVLYLYESPAGYGLVGLRGLGWIMFFYACFFTVKHYPEKGAFYYPFFAFYTLWFLSGPVIIIIGNYVIDKWVREKVVNGIELGITILGHMFFLFLTRPSAANRNFPYHVRTTQIATMEMSMNGKGPGGNLDAFNAHTYAPDTPDHHQKNFTNPDLFLVSGAVEMIPIKQPKSILKNDQSFPHCPAGVPTSLFQRAPNDMSVQERKPYAHTLSS